MDMQNIRFVCSGPDAVIVAEDRKNAVSMVRKGAFKKYGNVVVALGNGETFNLQSCRGKEYFGIKG